MITTDRSEAHVHSHLRKAEPGHSLRVGAHKLEEALDLLEDVDFGFLQSRLIDVEKITPEVASDWITKYKRWLALQKCHPTPSLVPTKLIDIVWHLHILHTKHYFSVCDLIFGEYLHHSPAGTMDRQKKLELKRGFSRAGDLWELYYREPYLVGGSRADCDSGSGAPCEG